MGNLETVRRMLACCSAGDLAGQLEHCTDNVVRGGEQRYRNHYIMFLHFRDGRVHRWREFSNPDVYRTAVGT